MDISLNQIEVTRAVQTLVEIDATEAAVNLSNILSALLKPTEQAEDALSEYGISKGARLEPTR